jgi:hypothetical protein
MIYRKTLQVLQNIRDLSSGLLTESASDGGQGTSMGLGLTRGALKRKRGQGLGVFRDRCVGGGHTHALFPSLPLSVIASYAARRGHRSHVLSPTPNAQEQGMEQGRQTVKSELSRRETL